MSNQSNLRIHTGLVHAEASKALGERVVHAKWKQTQNQSSKERAICIDSTQLLAPEVPQQFRPLVEAALLQAACETLKNFVNAEGDAAFEIPAALFQRAALVESFMHSGDSGWMSKQDLELAFTASRTWKRITGNPNFQSNAAYQRAAAHLRESILKLSGKAAKLQPELCDAILAKLDDEDLSTSFGMFVAKRIEQLRKPADSDVDLSML